MMRRRWVGCFVLVALMAAGCTESKVGSRNRPFSMYFVPSMNAQKVAQTAGPLTAFVAKEVSQKLYHKDTGFYIKASIPTSYVAVVEAFGSERADFAAFNTFSYILAKYIKKYPVEAVLTVVRPGNETTYKGGIFARTDSDIKKLSDLNGKKFAYTDPASTSGYILPKELFEHKKIKLGQTVFAQKHDNVITMIYQKQVDAGAAFYSPPIKVKGPDGKMITKIRDARELVRTEFPDVEKKIKIIGFTKAIPNEPWVIRSNIYKDKAENQRVKDAVVEALIDYSKTKEGAKTLSDLYDMTGLVKVTDDSYKGIKDLIINNHLDLQKLLQ